MFNKILIATVVCLFLVGKFSVGFAQTQKVAGDTVIYYLKYPQKLTTADSADFIRVILPKDKSGLYAFLEYNTKGKLISRGLTHSQLNLIKQEGPVVGFNANGKRKFIKNYVNGQLSGDSYFYYPNGQVYCVMRYKGSFPHIELPKKIECHDSTGKVLAESGKGHWLKFLGDGFNTVYEEGEVQNGLETGGWTLYTDGKKQDVVYKNGAITKPAEINLADRIYEKPDSPPESDDNSNYYNSIMAQSVRYPKEDRERNIQGKVWVKFVVEKDGTTTNFEITQAPSKSTAEEVLRVIKLSPPVWTAGSVNGDPVRSYGTLPVNFTLSSNY